MEFLDFDPDQKIFKLFSDDFENHCKLRNLIEYQNSFDPNGYAGLIYTHRLCKNKLETSMVNVCEVLKNPTCVEKFREIYNIINSEDIITAKNKFMEIIEGIAIKCGGVNLIGESNQEDVEKDFFKSIVSVVEESKKLNFEIYKVSNAPVNISNFSNKIQVFGSLAQCLLTLEKTNDGICVCYISCNGSLDGYFGFFVKSNGNIFSLNERIDERFIGQHKRFRNGRYAEDGKAFGIFPYTEICKMSGSDYKGYATGIEIDEQKSLNFFEISRPTYMKIIIMMMLILNKYNGNTINDKNQVVLDSLLPHNLKALENSESTELVKYENSAIIKSSSEFVVHFDREKFLNGEYNKQFDHSGREEAGKNYNEVGCFPGYNQNLVDIYGKDFQYEDSMPLKSDSSLRLIGNEEVNLEFVGNRNRYELSAYYELRKRLAYHIATKMKKEYDDFGGRDALIGWYRKKLLDKKDEIFKICREYYDKFREAEPKEKSKTFNLDFLTPLADRSFSSNGYKFYATISVEDHGRAIYGCGGIRFGDIEKICLTPCHKPRWGAIEFSCPFTDFKATQFFRFSFINHEQIEAFIGCELPDFCKEWRNASYASDKYTGNSILDACDYVSELESPVTDYRGNYNNSFNFSFFLGFSKPGLMKIK